MAAFSQNGWNSLATTCRLYDEWQEIIQEETARFHDQMAQKLPQIHCLEAIRAGANISGYLQKMREINDRHEALLKRDLCEEVTHNVVESMKKPFEESKQIKGKGSFAKMKEHIDRSVQTIKWEHVTEGLISGCHQFFLNFEGMKDEILLRVPQLLLEGYEPLWRDLDQEALDTWNSLKAAVLPVTREVKSKAELLKQKVEQRELCCAEVGQDEALSEAHDEVLTDAQDADDTQSAESKEGSESESAEEDMDVSEAENLDDPVVDNDVLESKEVMPEEEEASSQSDNEEAEDQADECGRLAEFATPSPCFPASTQ
ncbi:unnamed protein product [Durusdinium trenchii]|uniref:Uncharacterized protein n=1 Tax=Durusdinium trenchii TaxID=1381693 RepID=A0ABP0HZY9_9DINO